MPYWPRLLLRQNDVLLLGLMAIMPKGNETMLVTVIFYALVFTALTVGILGVVDAVRNFKGNDNG